METGLSIDSQSASNGRKRKSKFDILPEELVVINEMNGIIEVADNSADNCRKRKSKFDILPDELQHVATDEPYDPLYIQEDIASKLKMFESESAKLANQDPQHYNNLVNSAIPYYQSVIEAAFVERIEKALIKNFEYICRKDRGEIISPSSSGSTKQFQPKQLQHANLGIGAAQQVALQAVQVASVYISGLPLDITQEEIDILFSSQGKLKKIKIYTDDNGKPKGDALVTYMDSENVFKACHHFNGIEIIDGCKISVARANFSKSDASSKESKPVSTVTHGFLKTVEKLDVKNDDLKQLAGFLPTECCAGRYPVCLIVGAYRSNELIGASSKFFEEIEEEFLSECQKYGRIINLIAPKCKDLEGTVAATFETVEAAEKCSNSLQDRWFGGLQLRVDVIPPLVLNNIHVETAASEIIREEEIYAAAADDVDSFLQSLL